MIITDEIVRELNPKIKSFLLSEYIKDAHLADDIIQDCWIKALKTNAYEDRGVLKNWMFTLARNRLIDLKRKSMYKATCYTGELDTSIMDSEPYSEPYSKEEIDNLAFKVNSLKPHLKSTIKMRVDGRSFKEIAEIHGVSINTSLARMWYAINIIKTGKARINR